MFAVFGSPVAHSLSPAMHRAALAAAGINGDYVARDVDAAGFGVGIEELGSGRLDGINVTMPHKARAYEACEIRSPLAVRAGAVNTLYRDGGHIAGDNTDIIGIREAWRQAALPPGGRVAVLGAGGAAAAALLALDGMQIQVVARRLDAAREIIERTGVVAGVLPWDRPPQHSVVVNATPIGMKGEPLADEILSTARGLLDMAYGDADTPSVQLMREKGLPVAEGLDMLVGQAVASFRIWTGVRVSPTVMRKAALAELARRRGNA
jgi:shikimate dehydrogenase